MEQVQERADQAKTKQPRGMSPTAKVITPALQAAVDSLLALRRSAVCSVVDFYEGVESLENRPQVWQAGTGFIAFAEVLRHINLADLALYAKAKEAARQLGGWTLVRQLGVEASVVIAAVPNGATPSLSDPTVPARTMVIKRAMESERKHGVAPSPRQVATIAREEFHRPALSPSERKTDGRESVLEAECTQLRAANEALRQRVRELEAALRAAERRVRKGGRSRKAKA